MQELEGTIIKRWEKSGCIEVTDPLTRDLKINLRSLCSPRVCLEGAYNKLERFLSLCPFSFEPALGQTACTCRPLLFVFVSPSCLLSRLLIPAFHPLHAKPIPMKKK